MQVKEFQDLAMCTNDGKCTERLFIDSKAAYEIGEIINAAIGLSGEVGELNDMVKKHIFHGYYLTVNELEKETVDIY